MSNRRNSFGAAVKPFFRWLSLRNIAIFFLVANLAIFTVYPIGPLRAACTNGTP